MTDSRVRRRLGRPAAALAVLVLVVVAARATDGATVTDVVPIPQTGSVSADLLDNGTPVFVVHAAPQDVGSAGTIDVIQAFTTEAEGPVTGIVGWCAAAQQFTQPHLGPLYDIRGRRVPASTAGRLPRTDLFGPHTALDDLIQREVTRIEGRDQADDPLVVEGIQSLQDFQVAQRPVLDPAVPPASCRLRATPFTATAPSTSDGSPEEGQTSSDARLRLLDHGFLAGPLDADAAGWQITTGWIVVHPDGTGAWCAVRPTVDREEDGGWAVGCADPRPDVAVGFTVAAADVGGVPAVIGGPLGVRLADGVVQRVAVLPGSTWIGPSLQGSEVVSGAMRGVQERAQVLPLADARGGGNCRDHWPTARGGGVAVPVDAGTHMAAAEGPVAITVDAVTCTALLVQPEE